MEIAARNAMIILTYDKDFGELIFKDLKKHPSGVILFRLTNDYPEYAGELLLNIINEDKLILENHFTVIDDTKIRQRKFI